jgi:acetylornithine deacetylase/succinyl-diaminopimelate desuccinylase-like protein
MNRSFPNLLLLIVFVLSGTDALAIAQTEQATTASLNHRQLARDIFKELIEINTSLNEGCTKAAEAMAARLRSAGFPTDDIQLVGPHPKHMNLVVRYRGSGTLRPILFIGHLDAVNALRKDWSIDPFIFLEKDGFFYGRGTTDMKSDDASLVANLIRLRQEGFAPARDIIVALTEDEENGDANGVKWLIANRRDLIDAEFCINPDGGGGEIKDGQHVVMAVQTCEKLYADYSLEVTNKGGHSSIPVKENAIYRLAAALTRIAQFEFPIRLNETTRLYFMQSALRQTGQTRSDLLAMNTSPLDTAAARRLALSAPLYNSMMRTTCVATMLQGGHAPNALPQRAYANVNCRMLPDDTPEYVLATLKMVVADSQIVITCANPPSPAPISPLRKNVMNDLTRLTAELWPGTIVSPMMSTGATDGKALRGAGIPVYGVSGMFSDVDDIRAHGRDERLGVKEFYDGVEFGYRFLKAISSGSKGDAD